MSLKSVVVTVESEYLQRIAKLRGISRTRLLRLLMEKIVREERAAEIVTEADVAADIAPPRYRRFPIKAGAHP